MRRPKPPSLQVLANRLGLPLGLIVYKVGEWLMQSELPPADLLSIGFLLAAWFGGMLVADLTNSSSLIRQWWRYLFRICDIEDVYPPSHIIGDSSYVLPTVRLRFLRRTDHVTITSEMRYCTRGRVKVGEVITHAADKTFSENETFNVVVASILLRWPKDKAPPRHPNLGALGIEKVHALGLGVVDLLTIKIRSRWRKQTYQVYMRLTQDGSGASGRIFCMGEDHDAWETAEGPSFT